MDKTTYLLPFNLGTYSNGDECWLVLAGLESVTPDTVVSDNNELSYFYSVERRLAVNPAFIETITNNCLTTGDLVVAIRNKEVVTA